MNTEQLKIFESFVQEAVQQALPQADLNRIEDTYDDELVNWSETILVSIMSFQSGNMQGTAVIGCDAAFLEKTYPNFNANDSDKGALLQDWLGELSNLVLGRIKNKLLPFDVVLKLNPPSVTEASQDIFASYASRQDNIKLWFGSDNQYLCLSFSVDLDASVDFVRNVSGSGHELQPGDAIYRLNEPVGAIKKYDVIAQIRSGVMTDDDPALHDDFEVEFEDDLPPHTHNLSRQLEGIEELVTPVRRAPTSVPSATRVSYPDIQQSQLPTSNLARVRSPRPLEAVEWDEPGELCLRFQGGSIVRLNPASLLAKGTQVLMIEGYQLEICQTAKGVRVNLPELQISLETVIRAA